MRDTINMATLLVKCLNDVAVGLYKANTEQKSRDDSGYDLYYCGEPITIEPFSTGMLGLGISAELSGTHCYFSSRHGYELWPRSSISKTPLMLANSIGLIDYGYRGEIKACVRNVSTVPYTVNTGDKLFQLCMPSKAVFDVRIVDKLSETVTSRGDGGFGSTDRVASDGLVLSQNKQELEPFQFNYYGSIVNLLKNKEGQWFYPSGSEVDPLDYGIDMSVGRGNKTGDY
jgi:dUTP pyrophosphatase